ncbi:DNA-methyltransferase [Streptomyces marincola]|uniref:DNA-methyltransferase n=1 Tax=Streptomyces marincola TaxID=2878388 RepID=UPI001C3F6D7C|nr:site-specific DNA-methyltransferase [Streptomyces marincola]
MLVDVAKHSTASLKAMSTTFGPEVAYTDDRALVLEADSLEALRRIPDSSVSLILTDPPYHSTKKANIAGDRNFEEDELFLDWLGEYAVEWKRILKLSGTVYVFCASEMSARLETKIAESLRPINHIVWTKPNDPGFDGWRGKTKISALRQWYPHSERLLVFEHGTYGSREAYRRSPMGEYLLAARKRAGISMIELTEIIGAYGKVNRGGAVANWEAGRNIPSREQYEKLKAALEAYEAVGEMLSYEDLIRPMQLSREINYTDVWDFPSVRPFKGKHPAEKPLDMLKHIIQASTYPDDVVLDCFAGSGSSLRAALELGRSAIGIEIEPQWVQRSVDMAQSATRPVSETPGVEEAFVRPSPDSLF